MYKFIQFVKKGEKENVLLGARTNNNAIMLGSRSSSRHEQALDFVSC